MRQPLCLLLALALTVMLVSSCGLCREPHPVAFDDEYCVEHPSGGRTRGAGDDLAPATWFMLDGSALTTRAHNGGCPEKCPTGKAIVSCRAAVACDDSNGYTGSDVDGTKYEFDEDGVCCSLESLFDNWQKEHPPEDFPSGPQFQNLLEIELNRALGKHSPLRRGMNTDVIKLPLEWPKDAIVCVKSDGSRYAIWKCCICKPKTDGPGNCDCEETCMTEEQCRKKPCCWCEEGCRIHLRYDVHTKKVTVTRAFLWVELKGLLHRHYFEVEVPQS